MRLPRKFEIASFFIVPPPTPLPNWGGDGGGAHLFSMVLGKSSE